MKMAATSLCTDTIRLQPANYSIVPLNSALAAYIPELDDALIAGLEARPDDNREDFYDIELAGGWYYVHVCEAVRTVYLVAHLPRTSIQ